MQWFKEVFLSLHGDPQYSDMMLSAFTSEPVELWFQSDVSDRSTAFPVMCWTWSMLFEKISSK